MGALFRLKTESVQKSMSDQYLTSSKGLKKNLKWVWTM